MKAVCDTSALVSLFNTRDSNHEQAKDLIDVLRDRQATILLPNEIVTETVNVIGRQLGHAVAFSVSRVLLGTDFVLVETTPRIREQAFSFFRSLPDSVSFTDCLVMAVAEAFATNIIFGFDEVFRKNDYSLPTR